MNIYPNYGTERVDYGDSAYDKNTIADGGGSDNRENTHDVERNLLQQPERKPSSGG